jgi:opacity protein-like surface antigen
MKKIVVVLIALFTFSITNAQELSLGVKAGVNYAGTKTSDAKYNEHFSAVIGPHFGFVAEIDLTDQFGLGGEIMYSPSGFRQNETQSGVVYDLTGKVNYLSIPIMAKYYVTEAISIDVGPYVGFLLSSSIDGSIKLPESLGGTTTTFDKKDIKENYNSTDIGLGVGASYKMENGLFLSLRYSLGLTDISAVDHSAIPVTEGVLDKEDTIKNNNIQFSVGYKFM